MNQFTGERNLVESPTLNSRMNFKRMIVCGCPYRKLNPYVLMVQPSKNGPHLDAPGALNEPSNRRILT